MTSRQRGFTLIEMMAVVFFTALVLVAAVDFYISLSNKSTVATLRTRGSRRAVGILDRVARDLETTLLVRRPQDVPDALAWPWVFYAEAGKGEGADRIKFVHSGRSPRASTLHESDLEMVAYVLREGENEDMELWRWSSPHLPESLDRSFPEEDAEGSLLLARDVAGFALRFLDDEGGWSESWDSSALVQAGNLPAAVEIQVAVYADEDTGGEPEPLTRRVLLPVRPLDFEVLSGEASGAGDEGADQEEDDEDADSEPADQEGCFTVGQCRDRNLAIYQDLPDASKATIDSMAAQCFTPEMAAMFPVGNCP